MTAATARRYGTVAQDDNRRTIMWLVIMAVVVTLLTSRTMWAHVADFVGGDVPETGYSRPDAPVITDPEMVRLIKLTEDPAATPIQAPETAMTRNQAIPFSTGPVASARPFHPVTVDQRAALTALRCLTQAVYFEAAYEPIAGRRAVAQVVINRALHPAFPKSICGVVYQGVNRPVCQFSFTCDGSLNRRPNPAKWQEAEDVARAALAGYVEPSVGHATHYHANYVSPYWAPKLVKIAQLGAHIFYRWPGKWGTPGAFSGRYSGVEAIPTILARSAVVRQRDGGDGQGLIQASSGNTLEALQDRRADNDAGGRLDPSLGWELAIPEPEETSRASRMMARQQGGEFDVATKESGK
ncbi:cell wall hydrolase [Sphingopyxis microcysteis]|jgi:spore germination cell wall hydrolase CwlJ-like protein|uniref:cell wall hydrolase n=1 Tax=Sphingopyxis microcysteis TaxID=2484145 RepID=UPI00144700A6|nr:cell wall hydrolase [Sphingopyxis microcysteis]